MGERCLYSTSRIAQYLGISSLYCEVFSKEYICRNEVKKGYGRNQPGTPFRPKFSPYIQKESMTIPSEPNRRKETHIPQNVYPLPFIQDRFDVAGWGFGAGAGLKLFFLP